MGGAFDTQAYKWQSPSPLSGPCRADLRQPVFSRDFSMAKPELGLKRICVACGTKFYDMARAPAVCPKCGTEQPAEQPKLKRAAPPPEDRVKKRVVPAEAEGDEIVEVEADEDAEAIEDAEELEDADEALGEDIEVETDREEET
jgi:uncharacterized protein (TIGR02300 family)